MYEKGDNTSILDFKHKLLFANLIRASFEKLREKQRSAEFLGEETIDGKILNSVQYGSELPYLKSVHSFFENEEFKGMCDDTR